MMENLAKPPAPRKSSSADESSSSKADEEALRKFVVDIVGEKYWPVFEREEIEDLKCGAQRPNRTSSLGRAGHALTRPRERGRRVTGLFARRTLKCCTARDLQDMKIPLGPRLKLLSNLEGLAA